MIEALPAISAFSALVYALWYSHRAFSVAGSIFRTLPVALLAVLAIHSGQSIYLILGLILSAIGDFAVSREGKTPFLVGLGSAALGRLAFVILFGSVAIEAPPLVPVLGILAYAAATELWLAPYTDDLKGPVRVYVMIFTIMILMALAVPSGMELALMGALIFVAADTMFGVRLFRITPSNRWHLPLSVGFSSCYFTAQFLICFTFLA